MRKQTYLLVRSNPYKRLDEEGNAAGAAYHSSSYSPNSIIGGTVSRVNESRPSKYNSTPDYDIVYKFSNDPCMVPSTQYYISMLIRGDILPADAATAKAVGLAFIPPDEVIAETKARNVALFRATYGTEPACNQENE